MILDLGNAIARKPEEKDVQAIHSYRNDPEVYSSLGGHHAEMSLEDVRRWIEHHRLNRDDLVWVLAEPDTDACIGHCGIYRIDLRAGKAETGLAIAKSHWGTGLRWSVASDAIDHSMSAAELI